VTICGNSAVLFKWFFLEKILKNYIIYYFPLIIVYICKLCGGTEERRGGISVMRRDV
jgi:hypothetical protein